MQTNTLNLAKAFFLTTTRLWFSDYGADASLATGRWQDGFEAAGIDKDGMCSFDYFLQTINGAAHHPIDIQYPGINYLSPDESRLLQCMHLLQTKRCDDAHGLLSHWLPPRVAWAAVTPAEQVANALIRAGLVIERRPRSHNPSQDGAKDQSLH